jgi:phage terminase large subunit
MIDFKVLVTPVFQWNHDAIHQKCPLCTGNDLPLNEDCNWCAGSGRKYKYIIDEGSSRSSKTTSLIQVTHKYGLQNHGKRISVWRDTKKTCRDTVGHDVSKVYPKLPFANRISFNKTEAIYTFPGGATFELNGTDEPDKVHGYNCDVSWFNEPYKISKDTFDQIDMRTSDFVIIDWNPKEAHWIDDLKKDPRAIVIKSTFKDNPYCPPEQKAKILSYQPVKSCALISKTFTEAEAKVYDCTINPNNFTEKQIKELLRCKENERKGSASAFNWSVYGLGEKAEKPNRIFFFKEIGLDDYHKIDCKRYYAVDWGTVDPWAILEAKYYDGALYFHELNYSSENDLKLAMTPKELEEVTRLIDPEDSENQGGIVKWMFNKLQVPKNEYVICDNNRPIKINALHKAGWDSATTAPKPPGSIIDGIDILSNMPVFFTSTSLNFKYEQENYSRQIDRFGNVLDEPEDTHNHLQDCARYIGLFLTLLGIIKR